MTNGELGLVVFIFAIVWFAQLVPKIGARVGERFGGK